MYAYELPPNMNAKAGKPFIIKKSGTRQSIINKLLKGFINIIKKLFFITYCTFIS